MGFKKSIILGFLVYFACSYLMFILLAVKGLGYDISDIFGSQFGSILFGSMFIPSIGSPALAVMMYYGFYNYSSNQLASILLLLMYIAPCILCSLVVGLLSPSPKKSIITIMIIIGIGIIMNIILSYAGVPPVSEFILATFVFTDPAMISALKIILLTGGITNMFLYGGISVLFNKYQLKKKFQRKK